MSELRYPCPIVFGWGEHARLPELIRDSLPAESAPRVLLVATRGIAGRPAQELEKLLGTAPVAVCSGIPHDPPLEAVQNIVRQAWKQHANVVVAMGGGSVIDAAKAAAAVAPQEGELAEYFHGQRRLECPGLPLIALPTTAGSGAEITKNAVLTDRAGGVKKSLRSPLMVPAAAIVDPELTVSMPPELTAASGLDALTQAVEAYISAWAHAVSRLLAAEATRLLLEHLPVACRNGDDRDARTGMAEGSLLSAMAFSQSGLGAVHGLAHPLGVALGLPHGYVCAVLLPHILLWNAPVSQDSLEILARQVGCGCSGELVERIVALVAELGIPADFANDGLTEAHFADIVANCRSNSMSANPRPMTDEDVRELLQRLS